MKLASPRTIQQDLSEQRRVDIDNGIKLARQVDELREKLSKDEQRQSLYLQGITKGQRDTIEGLNNLIFVKEQKVEQLEAREKELLKPVTLKWDEVNAKEKELVKVKKSLDEERASLMLVKTDLSKRVKSVSEEEERIAELKKEVIVQADRVANASLQAQNTLLNARDEEKLVKSQLKQKSEELTEKEVKLSLKEKTILSREKQLEKEEQNIINEKIRLADQRATLQRAMSRFKK